MTIDDKRCETTLIYYRYKEKLSTYLPREDNEQGKGLERLNGRLSDPNSHRGVRSKAETVCWLRIPMCQ